MSTQVMHGFDSQDRPTATWLEWNRHDGTRVCVEVRGTTIYRAERRLLQVEAVREDAFILTLENLRVALQDVLQSD